MEKEWRGKLKLDYDRTKSNLKNFFWSIWKNFPWIVLIVGFSYGYQLHVKEVEQASRSEYASYKALQRACPNLHVNFAENKEEGKIEWFCEVVSLEVK